MPKEEGGMGFRDLKAFILALLAKQGWGIQQNPQSLVHRVFKAKYFMGSSFREAQLGKSPSYAWRSILAAKEAVVKGSRWIIGNGESGNIWKDRWIPTPNSFKVVSPRTSILDSELVSDLIHRDVRAWDAAKVRRTFLPHKAEVILGIPISICLLTDSLIWV